MTDTLKALERLLKKTMVAKIRADLKADEEYLELLLHPQTEVVREGDHYVLRPIPRAE